MELTSLGRAYLHSASEDRRKTLLTHFRRLRPTRWRTLGPEIAESLRSMEEAGYCAASWQPEVVAVATSLVVHGTHYSLNVSVSTLEPFADTVRELVPTLLVLKTGIERALERASLA